jgi:2-C-methyl-D-erythritol 4-phosphate cytidylyltransferase
MLAGRPLIEWSLESIAAATSIGAVVIAAPPDAIALADHSLNSLPDDVEGAVVEGGPTRAESVARALERVTSELVAIHDAARPLATPELFDAVLARLEADPDADAAIAAAPITDTVKRSAAPRDGVGAPARVEATLDRELLWAAQTPQAFRAGALRAAAPAGGAGTAEATDEAALIEGAGGTVLIEPAPVANLKVTAPGDLAIAETLLRAAGRL